MATVRIVKYVQKKCFHEELLALEVTVVDEQEPSKTNLIMKRSKLRKLSPILVDGILRVGGRLEKSSMSIDVKHPMIMSRHHHVTELIIRDCHLREGHI